MSTFKIENVQLRSTHPRWKNELTTWHTKIMPRRKAHDPRTTDCEEFISLQVDEHSETME